MAIKNLIKKRLATVASAETHKSSWEEGMEIDLIDEGIEPPIPTTADNGKIVKVANGKYELATPETGSVVTVSDTGTATDEVKYITIDGTEKKLAGGSKTLFVDWS